MDAVGAHQFWGFSPAADVQQISRTVFGASWPPATLPTSVTVGTSNATDQSRAAMGNNATDTEDAIFRIAPAPGPAASSTPDNAINILLLSPGDPRHILKTIAQRYRHSSRPLHFYVFDKPCEVLARHLLLLAVATDWELPIRQRAIAYLEIFGNSMVQQRTSKYIAQKRLALIDLLCNGKGPQPLGSVVDVELLKYKQRDELELIFKSWAEDVPFDMSTLRDHRLRHNYGARYDHRTNLVDWDYQGVIKKAAGNIHWTQYRDWRNNGTAFEFGDQTYDTPNRSLASYVEGKERGLTRERRGYWGDTCVSPFHALGTACYVPTDDEARAAAMAAAVAAASSSSSSHATTDSSGGTKQSTKVKGNYAHQLFEITSRHAGIEQWRHHAVEIATYNMVSWLHEIETGRQYVMQSPHDIYSGLSDTVVAAPSAPAAAAASSLSAAQAAAQADQSNDGAVTGSSPSPSATASTTAAQDASRGVSAGVGAMTPEQHAAMQAHMRAAAQARAKTIARAFKGVKIHLLTGDFEANILNKRRKELLGRFHIVHASSRSVHHLQHEHFSSILSPSGAVIVTETVRNVANVPVEKRDEFSRRLMGIAGRAGFALVGSDRLLSADTFSVGSVIDLKKSMAKEQPSDSASSAKDTAVPSVEQAKQLAAQNLDVGPNATLPFEAAVDGWFPGLGGLAVAASGADDRSTASSGGPSRGSAVGEIGQKEESAKLNIRCKTVGMATHSQNPAPLPFVSSLLRAAASDDGQQVRAAAARAANHLRAHVRGIEKHDPRGGDNPFPEALVFAHIPEGGLAKEISSVIATVMEAAPQQPAAPAADESQEAGKSTGH